jgi:crossover junction endodeoxyribonuclease RuvC
MSNTTMRRIIGIDPGLTGGLAVIETADNTAPQIIDAIDIPTVGSKSKAAERVDVAGVRAFIERHNPALAIVERAQSMPRQGISSTFKYARAAGILETAVILSQIPIEYVSPVVWKRHFKLPGGDKETARQRALELFPAGHALLARRKDHGRGEAMLIALYGAKL